MANGELLRQLFRAHTKRDSMLFREAAEAVIRDERAKNHRLLADDLERILLNSNNHASARHFGEVAYDIPRDKERGVPLLEVARFGHGWERLVSPPRVIDALQRIEIEHKRRDVLAAGGVSPKQKVLFCGPPGCGKTLAAKVISGVLSYPLVTVRFDAVVSSYLGETASNLRRVFEFISRGQWVVLFDEFDAIGKDRDNQFEHGELKRVLNALLQLMDAFEGESLLIAATNYETLLDRAIWRRFDAIVPFGPPSGQDRVLLLRLFLRAFDCSALDLVKLGRQLAGATGGDIEWVCVEAARGSLLDGRTSITAEDIEPALRSWRERIRLLRQVKVAALEESQTDG